MKQGLYTLIFSLLAAMSGYCTPNNKPNIIFIMADDLGYGDLSCYGATKINTPNVDKISSEGMMFTDAHSPASVCTPTRYAVLTGRYAWRGRLKKEVLWDGYSRSLIEPDRVTIGHIMKAKGYHTAQIGKWHLGWEDQEPVDYSKGTLGRGPNDLGFDYSFVTAAAHNLYPITFVENHQIVAENLKPIDYFIYEPNNNKIPDRIVKWHKDKDLGPSLIDAKWKPDQVDSVYTTKAIEFISDHTTNRGDEPFYLHLTPDAPHLPNNVPGFMKGTSQAGWRGDHIQMFDWMVGEINQTLKRLAIDDNTLIIITSDNGGITVGVDGRGGIYQGPFTTDFGHKSCGDLRGFKGTRWEGGHRIPLIVKWPNHIKRNTKNDGLICLVDMMASLASIVDYQLVSGMAEDSMNALPLMTGQKKEIRESLVMHDYQGRFGIRKGHWKLVDDELYNLENDLREENNVAEGHPEILEELKALLAQQQEAGYSVKR